MDRRPTRKELTHERIVETAARAIRRAGFQGVGVADIMKEAGLTHGGFYAHFDSRDALLVEALEHAGRDSAARIAQATVPRCSRGASPLRALVESYLSEAHLCAVDEGCPVAALASEMPHQAPQVREAAAQRVHALIALVQQALPATVPKGSAEAVASQMIGALQLARALGDNAQGRALLSRTRQALLAQFNAVPPSADAMS
ncbi:TetR/AcrR family transcriptional regulator [uncultured Azohydromonas sp.]|jgi:Transcriptional regulator|uniref:TetR/AcrR family transcriptional regulator n=1 Tax=uncultured Azohydromonas sp. TaxID=487342 RepID=UPI00261CB44B|nr:TetR/AcrR family transcriptional regulator [uncultured Azohydromonas sp.]